MIQVTIITYNDQMIWESEHDQMQRRSDKVDLCSLSH